MTRKFKARLLRRFRDQAETLSTGALSARLTPLAGTAAKGTIQSWDAAGNAINLNLAVVPVVAQAVNGRLRMVGTGFFVGQGLLVTAAHVLADLRASKDAGREFFLGIVQFMPGNKIFLRPITHATVHPNADVGLALTGTLKDRTGKVVVNRTLSLSVSDASVDERICTYAFPNIRIVPGATQKVHAEPDFYDGVIVKHYPGGRDRVMLPGPCYETTMVLHGAASGGPVFDSKGAVFAVNTTGVDTQPVSFVSCIRPLLDLTVRAQLGGSAEHEYSVRELAAAGAVRIAT